jgi:hypothetical protein
MSEEHITFILRAEGKRSEKSALLLGLLYDHEEGGGICLRNISLFSPDDTALYLKR